VISVRRFRRNDGDDNGDDDDDDDDVGCGGGLRGDDVVDNRRSVQPRIYAYYTNT